MTEGAYDTVALTLAETGGELRPALEAAQYGRAVVPAEPRDAAEGRAIARFVAAFEESAEGWEHLSEPGRTGAVMALSAALEGLERHGLFVHWAALPRTLSASGRRVRLPVALLVIDRAGIPTLDLEVPAELAATEPDPPHHH